MQKTAKALIVIVVTALIGGCQTSRGYDRPNTTQQQMLADRNECIQRAMGFSHGSMAYGYSYGSYGSTSPNRGVYQNCMAAKGYAYNPEGQLKVPDHLLVRMHD